MHLALPIRIHALYLGAGMAAAAVGAGVAVVGADTEATETPELARAEERKDWDPRLAAIAEGFVVFTVVTNLVEYVGVDAVTEVTASQNTKSSFMLHLTALLRRFRNAATRCPSLRSSLFAMALSSEQRHDLCMAGWSRGQGPGMQRQCL